MSGKLIELPSLFWSVAVDILDRNVRYHLTSRKFSRGVDASK